MYDSVINDFLVHLKFFLYHTEDSPLLVGFPLKEKIEDQAFKNPCAE